jgi:molybdopterin adenylyltransferase
MNARFAVGVLTVSDKGSQGKRVDESGPVAVSMLEREGFSVIRKGIVPDDRRRIAELLKEWVDRDCLSLIITSM